MFPFDGVLCQSRLMAKDFIDAGIDALAINYPSSTNGHRFLSEFSLDKMSRYLYLQYDGSIPLDELFYDPSFLTLLSSIDSAGGYLYISNWRNKKHFHPLLNGIVGTRRGAISRFQSHSSSFTYEQRWGGGTKLNVAAACSVPLLGYWQDSYCDFPEKYVFLEIGSPEFQDYLLSPDYRKQVLTSCGELRKNYLSQVTPFKWQQEVISFLRSLY